MPRYAQLVMGPAGSGKVSLEELRCVGGWAPGKPWVYGFLLSACTLLFFFFCLSGSDSSFNSS